MVSYLRLSDGNQYKLLKKELSESIKKQEIILRNHGLKKTSK